MHKSRKDKKRGFAFYAYKDLVWKIIQCYAIKGSWSAYRLLVDASFRLKNWSVSGFMNVIFI